MTWDALRKSLNGLVNKVNITNIKHILPEFFGEVQLFAFSSMLPGACLPIWLLLRGHWCVDSHSFHGPPLPTESGAWPWTAVSLVDEEPDG